jgi:hypothetical protein
MKLVKLPFNQLAIIKSVNKSIANRLSAMGVISSSRGSPNGEARIIFTSEPGITPIADNLFAILLFTDLIIAN